MSIISDVERQVQARIDELKPLVDEYHQLQEVLGTFEQARRGIPGRARRSGPHRGTRRSSQPDGSTTFSRGKRATEAIELVTSHPGITVADLAEKMGIGPTYLYRVMPALERDGKVSKSGKGYRAV